MREDDTSESLFVYAKIPVSSGPLKETVTVRGGLEMGRCMERRGEKKARYGTKMLLMCTEDGWGKGVLFCFLFFKQRERFLV